MFEQSAVSLRAGSLNPLIKRLWGLQWELIRAHGLYVPEPTEERDQTTVQSAEINTSV